MSGPQPISFQEIEAWVKCMRVDALPEEIEMLAKMDRAYRKQMGEETRDMRNRSETKGPKPKYKAMG